MRKRIVFGCASLVPALVCLALFVKLWGPAGPETLLLQFAAISAVGFWGSIGCFTLWDCWDEKRRAEEEARRIKRITRFAGWA